MKEYYYPTLLFKKKWIWFSDPCDIDDADMVNFFSYNKINVKGFKQKEGLTTVMDLSQEIDAIWNKLRKNFIRKQIQKGERNKIEIRQDCNFKEFAKIYKIFRKDKSITNDKWKAFRDNGVLFSAYFEQQMIAGGVFIGDKKYVRAWALASLRLNGKSGKLKEIIGQANRMIIWEAIKYFKMNKYEQFDLGGISPESPEISQRTLAEFKEAFGGERKECFYYYKVYSKLLKFLIKLR